MNRLFGFQAKSKDYGLCRLKMLGRHKSLIRTNYRQRLTHKQTNRQEERTETNGEKADTQTDRITESKIK